MKSEGAGWARDNMAADQIGTMTTTRKVVPALIDPPYWGGLQEWIEYRADLQTLAHLPGIQKFIREADANIARLRQPDK